MNVPRITFEAGDWAGPPSEGPRLHLNSTCIWVTLEWGRKYKHREVWRSGTRSLQKTRLALEGAGTIEEARMGLELIGSVRRAV